MQTFLSTLGWGLASLLLLSVVAALWEYLRATERRPWDGQAALPRSVSLDVDLAHLADAPVADSQRRQAALDGAMARLGSGSGLQAWTETQPMVSPGPPLERSPLTAHEAHTERV
jgi:hypothetical protein